MSSRGSYAGDRGGYWDRLYRSRERLPWEEQTGLPVEIARWTSLIPFGAKLLDLGCGRGHYARLLAEEGFSVDGIDVSSVAIAQAVSLAVGPELPVRFFTANILDFQPAISYDLAFDYSVFHHLFPADRSRYASTLADAVAPEGLVGIVCYSPLDNPDGAHQRMGSFGNSIFHPDQREVTEPFGDSFRLVEYGPARLGQGGKHVAHRFLFQRSSQR